MKKALLLAIVLLIVSIAFADVVIGTGTSVQYYPMSTLYNYYRSASLYTAAEINAAGTITDLKWYCSTVNNTTSFPIKIYMKHSTAASLAGDTWVNHVSDATEVFSATLAINAVGWFNFDITDFEYNGTDNLIVLVDSGSAAYVSPYVQWRYTTTVENMFAREDSDGSAPSSLVSSLERPNITFVGITNVAPPAPSAIVSPSNNAENVSAGATLNWLASNLATSYKLNFGTDNPPTNIVNGVDLGNVFTYDPTGDLSYSQLYYWQVVPTNTYGDASDCPVWSFTTMPDPTVSSFPWSEDFDGTWIGAPPAPAGWAVVNANSDSYLWSQDDTYISPTHSGSYAAHGMGNTDDWLISPPIDLTGVDVRMKWWDVVESATHVNSYKVMLSTTNDNIASFTVELGDYDCSNEDWTEHTLNLDAYTNQTVYIAFYQYASAATYYGFGIDDVLLEEIPTSPTFAYTPTSLAFDNTIQNTSSDWQNVTVSNIGPGTLDFDASDLSLTGTNASDFEFDASNLPAALTTGQSTTIPVRFNAPGIGSYSATLRMTYNAVDYDVTLTGTGVVPYVNMTDGSTSLAAGETWNFYDSGGVSGQYGSSENFTYTFNPPAGYRCIVNFSAFNTESGYDFLKLYDGSDATGTQIGNYSGTTIPASYTSILSGSLTFVFTSDSGVQYSGWDATISSEELPSSPILSYSPAQLYFPFTAVGESSLAQNVTITNIGGGSLDLTAANFSFSGTDAAHYSFAADNLPASLAASESVEIPVYFEPASRGEKYDAFLDITYGSKALHQVALGAYAYPDTYLTEGFEGSFPPARWANPGSWSKSTSTYYEGTASAYKYGSSSVEYILSTPKLSIAPGDELALMGRVSSTSASLDVIYSTDRVTWFVLETLTAPVADAWLPIVIDVGSILPTKAPSTGYYFGFKPTSAHTFYIDNVVMPPAFPEAPEAVTLVAPADAAANIGLLPTLSWTPSATGGVPTGYNLYLDSVDGSTLLAGNVSSPYTLDTALDYNTTYYWTVEAFNGIGTGPQATVRSFTTMADPTVTPDFTEGFEAGNTDGTAIVGWTQQSVSGSNIWTANTLQTTYNRTPRTGSWNAFLRYSNTCWMFKPVNVVNGTSYRVIVYARQDGATAADASIGISYGAADNAEAMTNEILAPTGIVNGDYQCLEGTLTPDATGVLYIGILGTINYSPWYISIDDISIDIAYDYPEDIPITVGEGENAVTITISGGPANNVPGGEIPEIPNASFVTAGSYVLQLIGAGPWTVTIQTSAPWGAYYQGGSWHQVEAVGGEITFTVEAAKDAEIPIILGDSDPTLPVTLASFTAILTADLHVNIAWMAASETDHAGYNLLRSEVKELSTALRINSNIIDEGTVEGTQVSYEYTDSEVYHQATYYYWLESVSLSGETEYHGPLMLTINANGEGPGIPEIPMETKLYSAFPNPFNPATNLRYSMKEAGDVLIQVFNVKGQLLQSFKQSHNLPGYYQVSWDGRDLNGQVVGTGVYFYRMSSGNYNATKKMVLAK